MGFGGERSGPPSVIGAASIAAGRRAARGERGAGDGEGAEGEVAICAWFFGGISLY
jgi:hypothetical protein